MVEHYVSGNWITKDGRVEEFVLRWTEFTDWSARYARGAQSFVLIRDQREPRHFVSFGTWEDAAAIEQWRGDAEFAARLRACVELCDEFSASDYVLAAVRTVQPATTPG
jgi:quinol monooxygenase YgiN